MATPRLACRANNNYPENYVSDKKEAVMAKTRGHNHSTPDPWKVLAKLQTKARPAGRLKRMVEVEMAETAPEAMAA